MIMAHGLSSSSHLLSSTSSSSSSSKFLSFFRVSLFLLLLLQLLQFSSSQQNVSVDSSKPLFPALMVFGDSIGDTGNNNKLKTVVKCNFPPYGRDFNEARPTGRFCNGKIASDFIASGIGLKNLLPAYLDPELMPEELLTGVSFASGGSGYDSLTPQIVSVLSLRDQLEMFREYKERVKGIVGEEKAENIVRDALYVSMVGSDDLANTYFSTPFRKKEYNASAYADLLLKQASSFYQQLYHLGARLIGVIGVPPVGCLPSQRTLAGGIIRGCVESYNQAARIFNSKLVKELQLLGGKLPGSKIIYLNIYNILEDMILHPSNYGFEVSNKGCCGTGNIEVAVLCNPLSPHTCEDDSKYLFWDSYHPTQKGYEILVNILIKENIKSFL